MEEITKNWAELHREYKRRFSYSKKMRIPFTPTDDEKEAHRQYGAWYASTIHGREILRASNKKFKASEKGKNYNKIYNLSKKHKESSKRWSETENGRMSRLKAQARYRNHKPPEHANKEQLIKNQKNKCAICSLSFSENNKPCLDHCHYTGIVRGALCEKCNLALGLFRDDISILEKAVIYLHRCTIVGEKDLKEIGLIEVKEARDAR